MKTVELKIDNDYYDELVQMLPKNRVSIVDESFLNHQKILKDELANYKNENISFTLYQSSIEKTNSWVERKTDEYS